MSEPKLISPLLDGFAMGNPMSERDGIRCCPAIKEHTDKKYIVKILTIPASQVQLDALLMAGAYKDPSGAMEYYKTVGEDILREAELLKKLSKLEGFLPFEGWQMAPITRKRLGYEIYLLGSYKRSLAKHVRKNPVTHLEAMNLGLDLCAAMTVARQAGAIYLDLKPTNIFMSDKKEYRIGDLGFVPLDAVSYTSLPQRYQSPYTAPELFDPMAPINLTADTYAVGMLLYQLYNDGVLPFKDHAPQEELAPPVNADYELAEVIMKAIHPDPAQRWEDPAQMGKALATYMQRNSINDDPITPYTPLDIPADHPGVLPRKEPDPVPEEAAPAQEPKEPAPAEPDPAEAAEESAPEQEVPGEAVPAEEAASEEVPEEAAEEPDQPADEMSRIFAKADDLISHETPVGVVLPEVPEPEDPFAFIAEELDELDELDIPQEPLMEEPEEAPRKKKKPAKKYASRKGQRIVKKLFSTFLTLLFLFVAGFGGFWAYQTFYLQTISSISIEGEKDQMLVTIHSDIDNALLQVTCSDQYGHGQTKTPAGGQVTFDSLLPNTLYTVSVEIDGFHKLVGQTSDVFTTDATTNIVSFTSATGPTDGSVVLSFTPDGEEPEKWAVVYSAEGEQEESQRFTGHSVTIEGLTIGKVYTFTLDAGKKLSISGNTSLEFMASRLVLAEDLKVASGGSNDMTISWKAPGDVVVESWHVRCYNEIGFDETMTVSDTQVYLTGIDPTVAYTVEVTAAGMTQPARESITANPLYISALHVDDSKTGKLTVTWEYSGAAPTGGWLLMYSIDGNEKQVVKADKPTAVIDNQIPGGRYQLTLQSADGISVFNSTHTFTAKAAEPFREYSYVPENVTAKLLKTPIEKLWRYESIGSSGFTNQFTVGDKMSVGLTSSSSFYLPGYEVQVLYVIRDVHGNILMPYLSQEKMPWKEIWLGGKSQNGELNVPKAPDQAGEYVLHIYFDGKTAAELPFTVS